MGRQLRRVRAWFGRRSLRTRLLLIAAAMTSPCWLGVGGLWLGGWYNYLFRYTQEDREFVRQGRHGYEDGLPSVGRKLKAEMDMVPDPDTALRLHPDWTAVKFKSGEWVFGYGINSHGIGLGRGTLVLKDSRGRVRIFLGHVCGPNAGIDEQTTRSVSSLDEFDKWLHELGGLREWSPD